MRFWVLGLLVLSTISFAGNDVGGGGIAEKNIVFAYVNLKSYADLCLASEACRLDDDEKKILKKIVGALPEELPADKAIVFKSEKATPGFFVIDGLVRIAKTGFAIGSPIYVNLDHLYTPAPLTLGDAVALLIHELGHHHGELSHQKLDLLGSKVQNLLSKQTSEIRGTNVAPGLRITVIEFGAYSRVLVADEENLFDISDAIREHARCKLGKPAGHLFWNLHFARYNPLIKGRPAVLFRGLLHPLCPTIEGGHYLYVTLPYTFEKNQFRLSTPNHFLVDRDPPSGTVNFD